MLSRIGLLVVVVILLFAGCGPAPRPPAVKPYPLTFLLPVVLHDGGDAIGWGCHAPNGHFAFGTLACRILITEGEELSVKDSGLELSALPQAMAFVGDKLMISTAEKWILYDTTTWNCAWEKKVDVNYAQVVAFDDKRFFVTTSNSVIERLDFETGYSDFKFDQSQSAGQSSEPHHSYYSIALSPDRKLLALGFQTGASIVDIETGKEKQYLRMPKLAGNQVAFSPDSQTLFVAGNDVTSWDLKTGKELGRCTGISDDIGHVAISPDGSRVAIYSNTHTRGPSYIYVLTNQLKIICKLEAHQGPTRFIAFRDNPQEIVSAGVDGDIKLWILKE